MKLKTLVAASVLALASAGAQAATTLTFGGTSDNGFNLGDTISAGGAQLILHNGSSGTSFSDDWSLLIDGGSTGAVGSFSDVELDFKPFFSTNITNMSITTSSAGLAINGSGDAWSIQAFSPGTYSFNVAGTISGGTGGSYNVGLTETVAPVPIPPAALLFGSALIGLAGLKRKKAAKELVEA
ncbi:MAG TPA: hypothetical protein ENI88_10845 [Desulfobulbus sp.]|nr:hypothetical protein [Desulfobulbus sp.]